MPLSRLQTLKNKAKLLQKAKTKTGKPILLKTALNTIAKNSGFASWRELKENIDANEILWSPLQGSLWNNWQASYEQAIAILKEDQFLLPYMKQFFICDIHYVRALGLNELDSDLIAVGNNWVQPKNWNAWNRLTEKIRTKSHNAKLILSNGPIRNASIL